MTAKNRAKGNDLERKIVERCKQNGLEAKRAWGSNGLSMGEAQEVDCLVEGWKVQAKKGYNQPSTKLKEFLTNVDCCVWSASDNRKNNGADYVIMTMDKFIEVLLKLKSFT